MDGGESGVGASLIILVIAGRCVHWVAPSVYMNCLFARRRLPTFGEAVALARSAAIQDSRKIHLHV